MKALKRFLLALDRWQRRHPAVAQAYAVVKKFSDDQANLYVVSLGWYGFTGIYPLLLVVVTIFGFIGSSLGNGIVSTLHQFPVIGADFNPGQGGANLHGSVVGLVIGVLGLLYGAQGVTQTAQQTMAEVWNVPLVKRAGFMPRLLRSLGGLVTIGGAFIVNAFLGSVVAGHGQSLVLRVVLLAGLLAVNVGFYYASFWILTPPAVTDRRFLPGALVGAVGFTFLTTLGTGLVQHQLKHTTATYGAFASVIGVVTYLLLLAKLSVYAAELNPVRARHLWPRALPMAPATEADEAVLRDLAGEEQRRPEEHIGVGFQPPIAGPGAEQDRADGEEGGPSGGEERESWAGEGRDRPTGDEGERWGGGAVGPAGGVGAPDVGGTGGGNGRGPRRNYGAPSARPPSPASTAYPSRGHPGVSEAPRPAAPRPAAPRPATGAEPQPEPETGAEPQPEPETETERGRPAPASGAARPRKQANVSTVEWLSR